MNSVPALIKKTFGSRLRSLRINKNLTQEDLAELFNTKHPDVKFSASTVGNHEQGANFPTVVQLYIYCDIFEVSSDYMLGRSNLTKWSTTEEISNAVKIALVTDNSGDYKKIALKVLEILDIDVDSLTDQDRTFFNKNIFRAINKLYEGKLL